MQHIQLAISFASSITAASFITIAASSITDIMNDEENREEKPVNGRLLSNDELTDKLDIANINAANTLRLDQGEKFG